MSAAKLTIAILLAAVLGVPFLLRPPTQGRSHDADSLKLVIVTPHVQQIRTEFGAAFDTWYFSRTGQHVMVDWRTPGGTSEIVRQLQSVYIAAIKNGRFETDDAGNIVFPAGSVEVPDLFFGGGSYDHGRVKNGVSVIPPGARQAVSVPISQPAGFTREELDAWFGLNSIGSQTLYDPDQYWIGTALSSFGIVFNRDVYARLGMDEPRTFEDLVDPRLAGWVALADPRQSGSITTTFDSILNNSGWDEGWRILRGMTANTRYFTNASTKPPIDVSQGEAAAGLAIDFYGRTQSQFVMRPGETAQTSRVGYVDPTGSVYIDADPVTMLAGGMNQELARQFIRFCLSEEGQALWQFPARSNPDSQDNPPNTQGEPMGPSKYELRRMPVRRIMYEKYMEHFTDQVNPFHLASDVTTKGWRSAIGMMMGAFAIDTAREQRRAWQALIEAKANPDAHDPESLVKMEQLFYAFPEPDQVREAWESMFSGSSPPDEACLPFVEANYRTIRNTWRDRRIESRLKIVYASIFRQNYARIVKLAQSDR